MDDNLMADPDSESIFRSDASGLRHISSSLFNIPGFLVGFSAKGSSDSDAVRSPTSPLDLRVFANLSNPFSVRSPQSPSQNGYRKKWDCNKIDLGIVNLLADENKPNGEKLEFPKRKNIIFRPRMKTELPCSSRYSHEFLGNSMKSNSLPRNYIISQLFQARKPETKSGDSSLVFGNEEVPLETKPDSWLSPSFIASTQSSDSSPKNFCSENRTIGINSSPQLVTKPSSLPTPLGHTSGSLSAHEIELSEDYTCIISHGPNPKTTRIFGDCILECHNDELTNFDKTAEQVPRFGKNTETSTAYPSDEFLSFCYSCKKKFKKEDDIYMYRGEKAFCSTDCRSEEIFAEEEMEKTCNKTSDDSPEHSDNEDLFVIGMPVNM
ncbi:hypothetical protein Goarm_014410 [Gossypium armourianum]|uniref:FLZ-type domain-containing protein n=1 Tax=Gossypium armourianum TaxID=34283 RepID=A0A7J9J616_9ROSI|nr:hypothetical protein [Gossypium armourianum]